LVKLGRNDNLTAAHLVLEMFQLIIVIQMILRDKETGANGKTIRVIKNQLKVQAELCFTKTGSEKRDFQRKSRSANLFFQ